MLPWSNAPHNRHLISKERMATKREEDEDALLVDAWKNDSAYATRSMTWDERRQLAIDIASLAPPDLPGVLALIQNFPNAKLTKEELPLEPVTEWEKELRKQQTHETDVATVPGMPRVIQQPIQMECGLDLDHAEPELLEQLRNYVDNCYVPHYVPKENCVICEGLWSCGRVIFCGNDACDTKIHEECFGVVLRDAPDGPWRCPSCLLGRQLMCAICMQYGGALKPLHMASNSSSEEQKWVHTLCALAIPELVLRDVPTMEPVDGFDEIENGRFRYLCSVCRKRGGASIICEQEGCNVGMHPLCAATAGFMIGSCTNGDDDNPLGVYCEKHLPASRIAGAKRWISEEDLVEEIMSEYSNPEDDDDGYTKTDTELYEFVLESTPYLFEKAKMLGPRSTMKWGAKRVQPVKRDLQSGSFANMKINSGAWSIPGMVVMGMKTQKPLVFPPHAEESNRIGIPPFPQNEELVGAIVDYLMKDQDEWQRARVLEWDTNRQLHLVHIISSDQKLWGKLTTANTLILYMPDEENSVDGPRVRIYRPVQKQGVMEWRPKPLRFAASS